MDILREADYPFPATRLKFLGTIIQKYRIRAGGPSAAFQRYFTDLDSAVIQTLRPALKNSDLLLEPQVYDDAGLGEELRLESIPDFNSLIAESQRTRKPVFSLTQAELNKQGVVWDNAEQSIDSFHKIFTSLADRIEKLTAK
ncbi:hypothetical protein [Nocardia rhizosphaerae]|uniref:Uncharacterized protein n=1 Tax=Nocardia rhizosphaerae TaxID=1691571 RepID=A0ABV8L8J4_9NOCA